MLGIWVACKGLTVGGKTSYLALSGEICIIKAVSFTHVLGDQYSIFLECEHIKL